MGVFDDYDTVQALHAYVRACGGDPSKASPADERALEEHLEGLSYEVCSECGEHIFDE